MEQRRWPDKVASRCAGHSVLCLHAKIDMAAAYLVGIVRNHPFVDGNKRTGFLASVLFLGINGNRFTATEESAAQAVLGLAAGRLNEAEIALWRRENVSRQ